MEGVKRKGWSREGGMGECGGKDGVGREEWRSEEERME